MASSIWKLGGLSLRDLGARVYSETWKDGVLDSSAQLAYYFLFSLFPLLIFLTSIFGFVVGSDGDLRKGLFKYLGTVLPGSALELVNTVIAEVSNSSTGGKLTLGLFLALWAASSGLEALTLSINKIYEVEETRSWWWRRLLSVFLTVILAVLIISALLIVLFGGQINDYVTAQLGFGAVLSVVWQIIQYLIVLAFVLLAISLIYYFSPDVKNQKWQFVTPGAIIAVVLWLLISFGFRLYLSYFNSYSATYGSLGAVIILMLWLYFTSAAILMGSEVNSVVEDAMAKAGDPEAKEEGEKEPQNGTKSGRSIQNKSAHDNQTDSNVSNQREINLPVHKSASEKIDNSAQPLTEENSSAAARPNVATKIFAVASMLTGIVRSFRNK